MIRTSANASYEYLYRHQLYSVRSKHSYMIIHTSTAVLVRHPCTHTCTTSIYMYSYNIQTPVQKYTHGSHSQCLTRGLVAVSPPVSCPKYNHMSFLSGWPAEVGHDPPSAYLWYPTIRFLCLGMALLLGLVWPRTLWHRVRKRPTKHIIQSSIPILRHRYELILRIWYSYSTNWS